MSNEDINKYDQLIDSKAAEMQFEFKEAYWTEMEALLNQKERKKGFFWWIFSAGAFAVIAGSLFLVNGNTKTASTTLQRQSTQIAQVKSSLLEDKKTACATAPLDKTTQSNAIAKSKTPTIVEKAPSIPSYKDATQNKKSNLLRDNIKSGKENHSNLVGAASKEKIGSLQKPSPGLLVQQHETQILAQKTTSISTENTKNAMVAPSSAKRQNSASIIAPWNNIHMSVLPTNTLSATNQVTVGKKIPTLKARLHAEHTLSIQAGIGYTTNGFSKSDFGGEKIHLGLIYTLRKGLWGFETGLKTSWNALSGLDYTQRTRIYGFTSSTVTSQLNYRSAILLSIPIEAKVNLKRHSIGLGTQCNVLLTTMAKSKQWDETSMQNGVEYGYRAGINPVFLSAILDYSYQISTRLSIGAGFSYGLTPFLSKEKTSLNTQHSNLFSGQLVLRYKLNYCTK